MHCPSDSVPATSLWRRTSATSCPAPCVFPQCHSIYMRPHQSSHHFFHSFCHFFSVFYTLISSLHPSPFCLCWLSIANKHWHLIYFASIMHQIKGMMFIVLWMAGMYVWNQVVNFVARFTSCVSHTTLPQNYLLLLHPCGRAGNTEWPMPFGFIIIWTAGLPCHFCLSAGACNPPSTPHLTHIPSLLLHLITIWTYFLTANI